MQLKFYYSPKREAENGKSKLEALIMIDAN